MFPQVKAEVGNQYKNKVLSYLLKLSLCPDSSTRQIICEKKQAPLAPPTAPNATCKNPLRLNQNNQSEPGGVSDGVSITACAHVVGSSPPQRMLSLSRAQYLQSGRNGGQITTKQPSNEKTAHPSFANKCLHDKDKQTEEDQ